MNSNPFDFGYVFSAPDEIFGPYSTIYFIVAAVGALVANYLYFSGKYRFKNNLLTYTLVNRASRNAAIVFTLGFVFFLCRIAKLQPFNSRLFLDITLVMLVYFVVRGIGYITRTYPKAKAEWQNRQEREGRKVETRPTSAAAVATIRPASKPAKTKTLATDMLATSSADAGGDENVDKLPAALPQTAIARQTISERGQKRRERKRNKR